MITRLVAGIVGAALLASLDISRVTAQESSALAQSQAEGARMALQAANDQLAAMGARTRMSQVEWLTRTDTGQIGQTVFFSSRGNKQLSADFVPGDPRRGGRTNILYLVDQSDGAAVGGLTNADTEAAIDRAAASWNDVACSNIPIEKAPDTGVDPDAADFFFGVGDWGTLNLGPVTAVDIVHAGFLGASLFDAFTPGCVPGSFTMPCGSVFILGLTFTEVFVDDDGNPTDVNNDGKVDVAFREIFYNNADPDANGLTFRGGSTPFLTSKAWPSTNSVMASVRDISEKRSGPRTTRRSISRHLPS